MLITRNASPWVRFCCTKGVKSITVDAYGGALATAAVNARCLLGSQFAARESFSAPQRAV